MFTCSVLMNSCDTFRDALYSVTFLLHFLFSRSVSFLRCLLLGELLTSRGT
ncbi:hypothetical protein HMPREF3190_01142 [Umbribacter vaginalis]|nr:hypothetical protein HMPREF3190_01142 [Coriobacteriales bacterium DNF00809]